MSLSDGAMTRPKPKRPAAVTLPSGTAITLERQTCKRCGKLVGFLGGQIISGSFGVRMDCRHCGFENVVLFDVA